ncbi:MAG: dihydroorotase [Candidatus Omnitrophota bacterium]
MKTLIRKARVLNPAAYEDLTADVLIDEGKIADIAPSLSVKDAETVDAEGLWLLPGLIDIHVHLREPGNEGKETIASGARAAAAGGIASIVCMANTTPPIDSKTGIDFIQETAKAAGMARVYPVGALTKGMAGLEMAPIGEMAEAGAVAISDDENGIMDSYLMQRTMEYSTIFQIPIINHAEDHALTQDAVVNEGKMSVTLGLFGSPKEAEAIQVARDLILAKKTGAHIHFAHISAAESVDILRFYKSKGVKATAETAPHYLVLTDEAVDHYNTDAKVRPPLRSKEDQDALYEGLRDGTIDCIATDHSPHSLMEKDQEFPLAPFGIVGLETLLPLVMGRIWQRSGLELLDLLNLVTFKPAQVMKLPGGRIEVGGPADLVLWNPEPVYTIDKNQFYSKSRNTPFHGWEVKGRVEATYIGGKKIYPFSPV